VFRGGLLLKEKLYFEDEMPVRVTIANVKDYPIHFHDDMEVVFVLAGSLNMRSGFFKNTLHTGDVYIMNPKDVHSYSSNDEDNLTLMLHIDSGYFSEYYPDWSKSFFVTDMDDPSTDEMENMRDFLARIIMEVMEDGDGYLQRVVEHSHGLITLLMDEFRFFALEKGRFVNDSQHKKNKIVAGRMDRIQDYLYDNYYRKVTLQEIGDREHLSIYYLSHVIKEATGLSYKEFLNFIRVEESEKLLLGSDMKISAISESVGFSAVRYYIKYFIKWFSMDPKVYREKHASEVTGDSVSATMEIAANDAVLDAVRSLSNAIYRKYAARSKVGVKLTEVDLSENRLSELKNERVKSVELDKGMQQRVKSQIENNPSTGLLFSMFEVAGGQLIESGKEYYVKCDMSSGAPHVSILVYDYLSGSDDDAESTERTFRVVIENGEYQVTRIMHTVSNIAAVESLRKRNGRSVALTSREDVLDRVKSYPAVTTSSMLSSGSLLFEVSLTNGSTELILIDPE
jgi:AraC-like DNA-binding protein